MTPKIFLASRVVNFPISPEDYQHTYLIYSPNGDPASPDAKIIRGGTDSGIWGDMYLEVDRLVEFSRDRGGPKTYEYQNYTTLYEGTEASVDAKWAEMINTAQSLGTPINDPNPNYNPDPNNPQTVYQTHPDYSLAVNACHTIVNTVMVYSNLGTLRENIPLVGGDQNTSGERLAQNLFPSSESLLTTANDDIIDLSNPVLEDVVDQGGNDTYVIDVAQRDNNADTLHIYEIGTPQLGEVDQLQLQNINPSDITVIRDLNGDLLIFFLPNAKAANVPDIIIDKQFSDSYPRIETLKIFPPGGGTPQIIPLDDPSDFSPLSSSPLPEPLAGPSSGTDPQGDVLEPAAYQAPRGGAGDPVVIDFDRDGVTELIASTDANAPVWDIDEDGFTEHVGWVAPDDALLVQDLNSDGLITEQSELFGSLTEDGFSLLAPYDSNSDGVIDSNDTNFSDLLLWQDTNSNAVTDAGELITLSAAGITSIDLAGVYYQTTNAPTGDGIQAAESTITWSDNGTSEITDQLFRIDNMNTDYIDDYTLDVRTLFLPIMRGYGDAPDLHIAMSLDETLLQMVQDIVVSDMSDFMAYQEKVTDIMIQWSGANDEIINNPNLGMNEKVYIASAKFLGEWEGNTTLVGDATAVWERMRQEFTTRFLIQSQLSDVTETLKYNPHTDTFSGTLNVGDLIAELEDQAPTDMHGLGRYWQQMVPMIDNIGSDLGIAPSTYVSILQTAINNTGLPFTIQELLDSSSIAGEPIGPSGGTKFGVDYVDATDVSTGDHYAYGRQFTPSTSGTDYLWSTHRSNNDPILDAGDGDDFLFGSDAANDRLYGGYGDDYIWGGLGDDFLQGNPGNDIIYGGAGNDIIYGEGSIIGSFPDRDDFIDAGAGDDTVYAGDGNNTVYGGTGDDIISTGYGDTGNLIYAGNGNDTITVNGVFDQVYDGAGNDIIYTSGGDNTYYLESGNDVIQKGNFYYQNIDDTIVLPEGVTVEDVTFTTEVGSSGVGTYDVIMHWNGNTTTIKNWSVKTLEFHDGTEIDLRKLDLPIEGTEQNDQLYVPADYRGSGINVFYGYDGDDTLNGSNPNSSSYYLGRDIMIGGAGNDEMFGGKGSDIYLVGGGDDTIRDYYESEHDYIYFEYGLTLNDLSFAQDSTDLVISISNGDTVTIENTFPTYGVAYVVEWMKFSDGTTADTRNLVFDQNGSGTYVVPTITYNTITGTSGDDAIYATSAHDNINGAAGNDTLYLSTGDYTVMFARGDGQDILHTAGSPVDNNILKFTDADHNQLWFELTGYNNYDLEISIIGTNDKITIDNANYSSDLSTLPNIETADGYVMKSTSLYDIILKMAELTKPSFGQEDLTPAQQEALEEIFKDVWSSTPGIIINGTSSTDTITSTSGDDIIYALEGDDIIESGLGNDTIYGGAGEDDISGEEGDDIIDGGDDSDRIHGFATGEDMIDGGSGDDDVLTYNNVAGLSGVVADFVTGSVDKLNGYTDSFTDIETFMATPGNDTITGDDQINKIYTFAGDDVITAGAGNDRIYSSLGNDTIYGEDGVDRIYADDGDDDIYGGAGNDFIYAGDGSDLIHGYATGEDTIDGGSGDDDILTYNNVAGLSGIEADFATGTVDKLNGDVDSFIDIETLRATDGNDIITGDDQINKIYTFAGDDVVMAGDGNDRVYTSFGDDTVYGEGGVDRIYTNDGADHLYGGAGNDFLYAGDGNDILNGGAGNDLLQGDAGADTFIFDFDAFSGTNTVSDFSLIDDDVIDLSELLTSYDPLSDMIDDFVSFTESSGDTIVSVDQDGTGGTYSSQAVVTLADVTSLVLDDMIDDGNMIV